MCTAYNWKQTELLNSMKKDWILTNQILIGIKQETIFFLFKLSIGIRQSQK